MPITKSEIRKDYVQDRYVIIAPRRGHRPHDVSKTLRATPVPKKECVFCPENIDRNNEVVQTVHKSKKRGEPWAIKVIKNKFPSVSPQNPRAYGHQEVVVETPDHLKEVEDLPTERLAETFKVYAERTRAISKDPKIDYILIFKNEGGTAGASLQHAHSQIFATEFLPPHLEDKSVRAQIYKLKHGSCVYCDVVKKERKGPRLIFENRHVIALCPWASLHNYEVWLLPKRHLDNVTALLPPERFSFARALKSILKKIDILGLPYNYYFHQVIHDKDQHLYLKIKPRGSVWAGVEIGSGLIINPVTPETAARFYRQK